MSSINSLKEAMIEATKAMATELPSELKAINWGIIPSGAGAYGQYFSILTFVYADTRAMGTWFVPPAIMKALHDESFNLEQIKKMFAWLLIPGAEFMDFCGLHTLCRFTKEVAGAEVSSVAEFRELCEAYFSYANRLFMWMHHIYPWGIGSSYPIKSQEMIQEMARLAE